MDIAPIRQEHQTQWADLIACCFDRSESDMNDLFAWLHQIDELDFPIENFNLWDFVGGDIL